MSTPGGPDPNRLERWVRIGFWATLALGWIVAVAYMWDAMATIPSAERLEESKLVVIPTPQTFLTSVIFSGMELAVVLAALWPWRPAYYASRLTVTTLALMAWFVTTTPMDLSRMDWVHRRWLAATTLLVLVALLVLLAYRLVLALARRATS
jgi:hypothetical protein